MVKCSGKNCPFEHLCNRPEVVSSVVIDPPRCVVDHLATCEYFIPKIPYRCEPPSAQNKLD